MVGAWGSFHTARCANCQGGACTRTCAVWRSGQSIRTGLAGLVITITVLGLAATAGAAPTAGHRLLALSKESTCATKHASSPVVAINLSGSFENALTAPVCIDGRGPFPFLIDTGASASALSSSIADRLHLPKDGTPQEFFGIGRSLSGQPVKIASWSVGPLRLSPQVIYTQHLNLSSQVDGLLGSDVLGRFGAIRLDYDQSQLTVAKAEGPPVASGEVQGHAGQELPAAFASFAPEEVLPLTVIAFGGAVEATAAVDIGSHPFQLAIDSGADISTIESSETAGLGLTEDHHRIQVEGVGGSASATEERVSSWTMGPVHLVPQDLIAVSLPGVFTESGIDGLVGADVLSQFRGVTIDYANGTLGIDQVPVV
jgi:predicted aspartyl protease